MTIKGINPLLPPGDDSNNLRKTQAGSSHNQTDRIEISNVNSKNDSAGHAENVSGEKLSDVSYRIELTKAKISREIALSGSINSNREFIDKFKLIKSLGLKNATQATDLFTDWDARLKEIRQRILDGYYDDPIHMAELADILMKEFDLE